MATGVIMPALEMAQESGVLVSWLRHDGEAVAKGEPLMEIETDKVTVEIEAPASGTLGGVLAKAGDVIPVGQTIAWILAPGERVPEAAEVVGQSGRASGRAPVTGSGSQPAGHSTSPEASPLARKIAEEHGVDLAAITSNGRRIEKADVLAYIGAADSARGERKQSAGPQPAPVRLTPASPKARRLAAERGIDIETIQGSGPGSAVLAADIPPEVGSSTGDTRLETPGTVWRVMAEHMASSWTTVPHFYLMREVDAGQLIEWRDRITPAVEKRSGIKPTYTDLLVKLVGFALREHPRLNAAWAEGRIQFSPEINVGIAVAVEDGLLVPVIRRADAASIGEIASQRKDLVERAQSRKLRPADISGGTFTLTNLGMYGVDAFNAIVNTPQAAILAAGRIAERVVPVKGQITIRPMMLITLSCDHRVVDGARGAQFLDHLSGLIEDPWRLLA
ncbi:MAG TPA: dihydrolipoamide acetyltransferase family protein [Anaerolineales bacterium]